MDFSYLTTLPHAVRHFARLRPEAVAYAFEGRQTTYAGFERNTNRVAQDMLAEGAGVGESIGDRGKNRDQ